MNLENVILPNAFSSSLYFFRLYILPRLRCLFLYRPIHIEKYNVTANEMD
jgi:hypothetical protein